MKINTTVLQALTVAVTLSVTVTACTKKTENAEPQQSSVEEMLKPKPDTVPAYDCPGCGMG
jgi:hypothetical protein